MSARKTKSLKDLIDTIDWMKIKPGRGSTRIPDDKVAVTFTSSKKNDPNVNRIIVRLGKKVLEQLKWENGDRICVYLDPDDYMTFMLAKSEAGGGYKLCQDVGVPSSHIRFKWEQKLTLSKIKSHIVEHETHKKHIVFRVNE